MLLDTETNTENFVLSTAMRYLPEQKTPCPGGEEAAAEGGVEAVYINLNYIKKAWPELIHRKTIDRKLR